MSEQRYSPDLIVTAQDFAECSWKNALANEEREGYSSMWQAFSSAARKASEGRERLFGKAFYAGFDRDFTVSMHLLIPQIEHMVRFHLKNAGVKTTNIDIDGIENENGLSTLMGLPEAKKVFGKDLSFETQAMFCDALGPNLRNEVDHGLLDDDSFQSVHSFTRGGWG